MMVMMLYLYHVDDFVDDFVLLAAGKQGEVVDCQN